MAGEIVTAPIPTRAGTIVAAAEAAGEAELSQNFLTGVFYLPRRLVTSLGSPTRSARPGDLGVEIGQRSRQHLAMPGIRGRFELLQDSLPRQFQGSQPAPAPNLLRS